MDCVQYYEYNIFSLVHSILNLIPCGQGSHVMTESGSYVLQWRCDLLDNAHRAAQLMYFHETLASHHYK